MSGLPFSQLGAHEFEIRRSLLKMRDSMQSFLCFSLGVFLACTPVFGQLPGVQDVTHNVDPFIGVDWGGNTFVGAAIPFGMVKLGPDMATFDNRRSGFGYFSSGDILGFSHLHLSGAQGKYGNILVAPVTGAVDPTDIKTPRTDEVAKVGYYSAKLTRYHVGAELTSSRRVGFHRYIFPASQQSHITVNVGSALDLGVRLGVAKVSRRRNSPDLRS
jgi:putative alpha-1,2-mannosidase